MKKRAILFIISILVVAPVIAVWNVDVNNDGCIDQKDLDLVTASEGVRGASDYDVTGNMVVDQEDIDIVQSYIDRGSKSGNCNGFLCKPELCNGEDDDCDGNVDEDSPMCSEGSVCMEGECVVDAGDCYDSDGYNIYARGKAVGTTADGLLTEGEESCYQRDIYNQLKKATECYGKDCSMLEYSCSASGQLDIQYVDCEYGCRFGKCRNITKRCHEEDNGLDMFRKSDGWFDSDSGRIWLNDTCIDKDGDGANETLVEYVCLEKFDTTTSTLIENYTTYDITCSCNDGRCTNVKEGSCADTDGTDKYTKGYRYSVLANGTITHSFDSCMVKSGSALNKAERCSGDNCYVKEYSCDFKGNPLELVQECNLGCDDGKCTGAECSSTQILVTAGSSTLGYDADCEYRPSEASNPLDLPGSSFDDKGDFACCSGNSEAYCVHDSRCYPSSRNSNYYNFSGEIAACGCSDSSCSFEDGNHAGLWYDLDSSKDLCEGGTGSCNIKWYSKTGFRWIKPGETMPQQENVWEYEDTNAECCGDDSGEFVVCEGTSCICCGSKDDTYDNGACKKAASATEEQTQAEPAEAMKDNNAAADKTDEQASSKDEPLPGEIDEKSPDHVRTIIFVCVMFALAGAVALMFFGGKRKPKEEEQ